MIPTSVLVAGRATMTSAESSRQRLEQMFKAHHELVWRTLRRLGLDPNAAADLAQQVYLIAAERLGDIHHGSERAFLVGTAIRLAHGNRRKAQRVRLDDDMDVHPSRSHLAEDLAEQRRAIRRVDRVLGHLKPDLLAVFVLFEIEGMSTPEVASLLSIPIGTAASRLRRARKAFHERAARLERACRREEQS